MPDRPSWSVCVCSRYALGPGDMAVIERTGHHPNCRENWPVVLVDQQRAIDRRRALDKQHEATRTPR